MVWLCSKAIGWVLEAGPFSPPHAGMAVTTLFGSGLEQAPDVEWP